MSVYRHLTLAEREYIMVQRARGRSITAIAAALMRNKSTISREIKRNSDSKTYSASQAQACYQQRRKACRRKRKLDDPERFALVKRLFLQKHWSPEQIQHRLRHEGSPHAISYATIYRGIYAGRFNDPDWVKSGKQRLRHRGKKRQRKGARRVAVLRSTTSCRNARRLQRSGDGWAIGRPIPSPALPVGRC